VSQEIRTIGLGGVNCYLATAGDGFVLIDTGFSSKRAVLDRQLGEAGCQPGNLKLVLLTHGDTDHTGNSAFLRQQFGARIAMHEDDSGMAESGDMSLNRRARPDGVSIVGRAIMLFGKLTVLFGGPSRFEGFKPDLYVADGEDLSGYGLDARVIHIPGHSKGSIGVLTAGGDLLCGDLLYSLFGPSPHFLVDDSADYSASIEKLKSLRIGTVYPGHGKPFRLDAFLKSH
jgi:hydroxyacylglutathione hydrolase